MITMAVLNDDGTIEHMPRPDLHFRPEFDPELSSELPALLSRLAVLPPSRSLGTALNPPPLAALAPYSTSRAPSLPSVPNPPPTAAPPQLSTLPAVPPPPPSLPPTPAEIRASWDRAFARLGLLPRSTIPPTPMQASWDRTFRRFGLATRADLASPPPPDSPLTETQLGWTRALHRAGLLRPDVPAPAPTAMQASWERALRAAGCRLKSDDDERLDPATSSPGASASASWDRAFARMGLRTR